MTWSACFNPLRGQNRRPSWLIGGLVADRFNIWLQIERANDSTGEYETVDCLDFGPTISVPTVEDAKIVANYLHRYVMSRECLWRYKGRLCRQVDGLGRNDDIVLEDIVTGECLTVTPTITSEDELEEVS